ncbi:MAG: hypothetical protein LBB73_02905 [Dysgonamonadaceae bacterium]|jgi:hypothetical protein|nr:hypothetical protein [Dysgonamonadaceae bacterium]
MKKEEVPQDGRFLKHTNLRDIYYALDENGNYCQVQSVGWEAKNEALSLTWENILDEAESVRREVLKGEKSPLAYHIQVRLFDVGMLSAYSGIPKKTIKKHLQAKEFERIDDAFLEKYANTLDMTVDELKKV